MTIRPVVTELQIFGGPVIRRNTLYGVEYSVDLAYHPYFDKLSLDDKLLILEAHSRRCGTTVTEGGADTWTAEQFLQGLATRLDLGKAFAECLVSDNFVRGVFGVVDTEAAKARIAADRQQRIDRIRAILIEEEHAF